MSHGERWRASNLEVRRLIREREAFSRRKVLVGEYVDGLLEEDGAMLAGRDLELFLEHAPTISYVVWSYGTPIHWVTLDDLWHTIDKCPSKTTAGHRNLCPGYGPTREPGWAYPRNPDGPRRRIRKEKA